MLRAKQALGNLSEHCYMRSKLLEIFFDVDLTIQSCTCCRDAHMDVLKTYIYLRTVVSWSATLVSMELFRYELLHLLKNCKQSQTCIFKVLGCAIQYMYVLNVNMPSINISMYLLSCRMSSILIWVRANGWMSLYAFFTLLKCYICWKICTKLVSFMETSSLTICSFAAAGMYNVVNIPLWNVGPSWVPSFEIWIKPRSTQDKNRKSNLEASSWL